MPSETNEPQNPPPAATTSEIIFRNAIMQNQAIHARALQDIQRHTDDIHEQLRAVTQQHVEQLHLPDFPTVRAAARVDPAFWPDTVARAVVVLQQRGLLPSPPEPPDATENPPAT